MGNAWAVWLNEVFCFSPFFVGAVSAAGDGFLYCFKEHYGHAFLFTGFRNLRGFFRTVTQRTDCITQPLLSLSLLAVCCFCHKLDFLCNCSVNSFYQKLWTKSSRWFQQSRERRREGEKRRKMEIKLKCKFVPILSFSLIRRREALEEPLKTLVV